MGKDGNRWGKMQKDTKRYRKIRKDSKRCGLHQNVPRFRGFSTEKEISTANPLFSVVPVQDTIPVYSSRLEDL